jgi:LPS-assembly protein
MFARCRAIAVALTLLLSPPLAASVRAQAEGDAAPAAAAAPGAPGVLLGPAGAGAPDAGPAKPAGKAAGAASAALPGDEVLLTADHVERSNEDRVVTADGAVTIRHRDMRLVADRVVYSERTKEVVADGNVVLDSGPDRLQGAHLELNLDTRIGFIEHAQGFLQTYYFTGDRLEKRGPDHYYLRGGSFTTCEGVLPDWSFHATSTELTIDEYMHAWNPTLRIMKLPVLYFPYAVFPIKRERSTGLLIPGLAYTGTDGITVRNAFYWAPYDNFDATIGIDYLQKTGWGASGEMRYLLSPETQGIISAYYLANTGTDARRWSLTARNSQALPLGLHAEVEAFFQSDREFIATQGATLEERSSESTSSSFFINRSLSAWNFALSGRTEVSLVTEKRTTLTRFPELTIDRTSTRLFGTDLFLKVAASAVDLSRDDSKTEFSTTRLHVSPELTMPLSLGSAARIIPMAGYAWTDYSKNTLGEDQTRSIPYFKLGLEGPRPYRIWDLAGDGRYVKLKHLIEPSISYVYTPEVNQETIPLFDSIDRIPQANRIEYSLTNTLFAKMKTQTAAAPPPGAPALAPVLADPGAIGAGPEGWAPWAPETFGVPGVPTTAEPLTTTQELLWIKLSQNYTFADSAALVPGQPFSPLEWDARLRPLSGLEVQSRGNYDVYGKGVGYQNLSLIWKVTDTASLQGDWRTTRDSDQDFLDLSANFSLWHVDVQARSRYNLAEKTFVENRVNLKYVSQCWDITLGYVHWTTEYQYSLTFSLKGIGTIVKI